MSALPSHGDAGGPALTLKRFTAEEFLRMVDAQILGPSDRVELIDGMIVAMTPAGARHHHVIMRLTRLFAPALRNAEIAVQTTLRIGDDHVFDPDFMLLRPRKDGYKTELPRPADVMLLVEVADSSIARDRQVKAPAYAAAGIEELWIADAQREVLLVHRAPSDDGTYSDLATMKADDAVEAVGLRLRVGDIFD